MKSKQVIEILQRLAPSSYAMSWDNSGFLVGRSDLEVKKIAVALDATNDVIKQAVFDKVDMIVTHHPMIFSNMKRINDETFLGRKILTLIENHMVCYAMHTNYDIAGGMPELAAKKIGLIWEEPLEITNEIDEKKEGIGKIGRFEKVLSLEECTNLVKESFGLDHILVFGDKKREIKKVAISPGSGRSMINEAVNKGADVIITGDIGHHEGLDAMDMGIAVIEAGHYGIEQIFIEHVANYLRENTSDIDILTYHSGVPYSVL